MFGGSMTSTQAPTGYSFDEEPPLLEGMPDPQGLGLLRLIYVLRILPLVLSHASICVSICV